MANENENKGTGIKWSKVAVRDAHGAIDVEATLALCGEELSSVVGNEVELNEIATAVKGVFDKLVASAGGKAEKASMELAGVATRALEAIGDVPFGQETEVQDRIKDFVRGESERFVETNGAEGAYHIKRGKDGGVRLNTPAYVTEFRKLQEKKAAAAAK